MVNLNTANAHHELEDQNIVNGRKLSAHCANCHGVDLEGQLIGVQRLTVVFAPQGQGIPGIMILKCYLIILNTAVKNVAAVGITDYKRVCRATKMCFQICQIWEI